MRTIWSLDSRPKAKYTDVVKKETIAAAKPPIRVLPFRARIDPQTARKGWDAHAQTWAARKDLVFVGGGTYSNRKVVRW